MSVPQTSLEHYRQVAQDVARGEELRLTVTSGSMAPLLRPGDSVLVEPITTELKLGEIVVLRHNNEWITHRVLRIEAQRCQTYGDNARSVDEPITLDAVVGRVVAIERAGRTLDLRQGRWPVVNRALSWAGRNKLRVLNAGRQTLGQPDRLERSWRTWLAACGAAPFQIINRVVVWWASR